MATITHKHFANGGPVWVVRHVEQGHAHEEEFETAADADIYKRQVEGPERWELEAGPVVRNDSYVGHSRSVERHTVHYLQGGQRQKRTFGDAGTAARFCASLKRSAAPPARERPQRTYRYVGASFSRAGEVLVTRASTLAPASFDAEAGTIDCLWTTGATVTRRDDYGPFAEVLEVSAKAIRLGRLNAGAPFLDSHQQRNLADVIGAVVPGSARIEGNEGWCRIKLSEAEARAGLVADIRAGVIRNVSVGYAIHAAQRTEGRGDAADVIVVTDWEPMEISAVAIPADPNAQLRHFA